VFLKSVFVYEKTSSLFFLNDLHVLLDLLIRGSLGTSDPKVRCSFRKKEREKRKE
jgi:hypothetical protein